MIASVDLGGASPAWMFILLAVLLGPFVWGIVYGIRHRSSGSPSKEDLLDANTRLELERFRQNTRPPVIPPR